MYKRLYADTQEHPNKKQCVTPFLNDKNPINFVFSDNNLLILILNQFILMKDPTIIFIRSVSRLWNECFGELKNNIIFNVLGKIIKNDYYHTYLKQFQYSETFLKRFYNSEIFIKKVIKHDKINLLQEVENWQENSNIQVYAAYYQNENVLRKLFDRNDFWRKVFRQKPSSTNFLR